MMATLKPVVRSVHAVLPRELCSPLQRRDRGFTLSVCRQVTSNRQCVEGSARASPLLAVGRHEVARLELLQRTQTCLGADECG